MEYLKAIAALALFLIIGRKVIKKAARNIANGMIFDENFLMCIAGFGALCIREYAEAVAVMALYRFGEYLQKRAVDNSRRAIADLMDIVSDYANAERNGTVERVDPEDVEVGEIIVVKPGEKVPIDGTVESGSSGIDMSAITGESVPVSVSCGSSVYSGSINLNAPIRVRTVRAYSESTASKVVELVEEAAENRAETEEFITRFAKKYTPAVCALSLILILSSPFLFDLSWAESLRRGLIFLVVSCPCALVISIPLGFFGGIGAASRKGILVKGGNYLEALANTGAVLFDKTGTLTKGVFRVTQIRPVRIKETELLELAALAESISNHPIAQSLSDSLDSAADASRVSSAEEIAGKGVRAVIDGKTVYCGNEKLLLDEGIAVPACDSSGTLVHIASDGFYEGFIVISDEIKDDAKDAVSELSGIRTLMLTGDKEGPANSVSRLVGIKEYYSGLLPQEKLDKCREIKASLKEGENLVFVGDGINDAPVLAAADIGFAMGAMGSAAAAEAADIVLMNDKPGDVAAAIKIAKKTMRIVRENIVFSLAVKFGVMALASFGLANMYIASFADVGVMLLAVLNSMRMLRQ